MRSEVKRLGNFAAAHWLVIGSTGLVLLVFAPALVQGGLLADDYVKCLGPIQAGGYGPFLRDIWHDTGVVRPAQIIEVLLISKTCTHLPFGLVMLVPLSLKFAAGLLLWGLLCDLRVRTPWPEVGVAMWLLEPVGTEAALWPSALHVHLGLVCALAALRLYRRGFLVSAAFASAGAALSVEQVIFALPFAVWVTGSREHRRRATAVATVLMAIVIVVYATWPGHNERQALTLGERWHNVVAKGAWYRLLPHQRSGAVFGSARLPVGVSLQHCRGRCWGREWCATVCPSLARSDDATSRLRHRGSDGARCRCADRSRKRSTHRHGSRILGAHVYPDVARAVWRVAGRGASITWRRVRAFGALAGTFAAFAILSLALSVFVRVRTDRFNRAAAEWIAARTVDGSIVAVCDVDRTVVNPAPLGAFHLHELHSEWSSWIEYHTGRRVQIRRSGQRYWGARCPDLRGATLVISFPRLVRELSPPDTRYAR